MSTSDVGHRGAEFGGARVEVEVVLAWPRQAFSCRLRMEPGSTVSQAVARSGMLERISPHTVASLAYAVFGETVESDHVLSDGDRVELLRPLTVDPKEARRRRAGIKPASSRGQSI